MTNLFELFELLDRYQSEMIDFFVYRKIKERLVSMIKLVKSIIEREVKKNGIQKDETA